jgi:uncharacterized protein YhaN
VKIRDIHVEGFGALRDRSIGLEGQAVVFYGPNEAGKSTLLHLIRAVLFGFPPRGQGAERFEPAAGGAHGGSLILETVQGDRIRVARRSADASGGKGRSPSAGIVSVTLPDGTAGGEELLRTFLGGVTGEQFRNLFAFTLTELQELRTLTTEELGSFLHSAGLGVKASAVTEAERRLVQELEARFKPRGRNQGIPRLLAEAEELDGAWRRSLASAGRYNALEGETAAVTKRIAGAEEELEQLRRRLLFLRAAFSLRERWLRRRMLLQELESLPDHTGFPEDGLERQDILVQELERSADRLSILEARLVELEAAVRACTDEDHSLIGLKDRLSALLEELSAYRSGFQQERELLRERERLNGQLHDKLQEIGLSGLPVEAGVPAVTLGSREEAANWRSLWQEKDRRRQQLEGELEAAQQQMLQAEEKSRECLRQLDAARRRLEEQYPSRAEELADKLPLLIRELRQDIRLAAGLALELKHTKERELEHRLQLEQLQARDGAGEPDRTSSSAAGSRLAGMVAVSLGAGSALFFALRAEWLIAAACMIVLGGAGAVLLARRVRPEAGSGSRGRSSRSARPWSGPVEPQAEASSPLGMKRKELEQELAEHHTRIKAGLDRLGIQLESAAALTLEGMRESVSKGDESLPDQLEQWHSALTEDLRRREQAEDKWRESDQTLQTLVRQAEWLQEQLSRLDREKSGLLTEWRQWLAEWGITEDTGVSPAYAPDLLVRLEQAGELSAGVVQTTAAWKRLIDRRKEYESEILSLSGKEVSGPEEMQAALQALRQAVEAAAERWSRKRDAEAALEELLPERRRELELSERCRQRQAALWKQGDARDEEEFRSKGAGYKARLELTEELNILDEVLALGVGPDRLEELHALLGAYGAMELEEEVLRTEAQVTALGERLDGWKEEKGRLAAEHAKLLDGSGHAGLREAQEEMLARFGDEAAEWAVYAVAAGLLRKAKSVYERERQPGVLRQASEHFSAMTGGRYSRIVAPVGEQRLMALRPDGEAVDSPKLSRGTAEQLYLSLRFALAAEFAKRTPLPIIMDDILVNFDGERLRRTAGELARLAQNHQILFFTCHQHVLEAMEEAIPSLQKVRLA